MCVFISTYVRDLAIALTQYHDSPSISINDQDTIKPYDIPLNLAHDLEGIPFSDDVQRLDHTLRRYLGYLSQRRPLGKGNTLLRLSIRYLAKELADHLSYWSWNELFSPIEQTVRPSIKKEQGDGIDQYIADVYLDVYVAFAILEARIEGRLSPCEGILIVRERQREKQERAS